MGARYVATGHLLYAAGGVLMAVPFDLRHLQVTGSAVPVVEGVARQAVANTALGHVSYAVSDNGTLIYVPGPRAMVSGAQRALAFVDAQAQVETLTLPPGAYVHPRISPDGTRLAFGIDDGRQADIWIYELSGTSQPRQLTFGGRNHYPVWSADGLHVTFQSDRDGERGLYWQVADGSRSPERLTRPEAMTAHVPDAWSPDGNTMLLDVIKESRVSLWALSLSDRTMTPFGQVQSAWPTAATFSHDGRWVAYTLTPPQTSTSTLGTTSIFVQPFPITGAQYKIATGVDPAWLSNDSRLSYVQISQLTTVDVTAQPTFSIGKPTRVSNVFVASPSVLPRNYDITRDGKRFVGVVTGPETTPHNGDQIHVVLNWTEELMQRVPVR
jgi:serine/threonine-protein kinase